jgi:ABC-type Fe3+-hydroxamate transport system substrate-binding protein
MFFIALHYRAAYFYSMILQSVTQLPFIPKRIVSLVPSQTELLHYLGLEAETVGITKFCIHPKEWFDTKTRIGGTKTIDIKRILELKPDLIIANKEENVKEQVDELAKHFNVWVTDVNNVADALQMINDIGTLTGKINAAQKLVTAIQQGFAKLQTSTHKLKTCYLIWKEPYMTVGGDTFIHDILQQCGLQNMFAGQIRYPEVSLEVLQNIKPQLIILSSEPFPFKQKHIDELQQQLPGTVIILANGEMFSWYGSRMLLIPQYLNTLLSDINRLLALTATI